MKKIVVVLVVVASLAVVYHPHSLADRVESVRGAVVHIEKEGVCQGSGFIVSHDGIVVTARHVTDSTPGTYKVTTDDGTVYGVQAVVEDREYDIAFLQLKDAPFLPVVRLADLSDMRVGDPVFIIGSPFGRESFNSVTLGILSAKQRDLSEYASYGWRVMFQSDATAEPGNSGGPVFNIKGRVIGVLVAGLNATVNYSVPVNVIDLDVVRQVLAQTRYQTVDDVRALLLRHMGR